MACVRTTRGRSLNAELTRWAPWRPGADRLACTCGSPKCPVAEDDGRAAGVVIHVLAEAATLDAEPDPAMSGESAPLPPITRDTTFAELLAPRSGTRADCETVHRGHRRPRRDRPATVAGGADPVRGQGAPRATPQRQAGAGLPTVGGVGRVRPTARSDVPVPELRCTCRALRCRPHDSVALGSDARLEPHVQMPKTPFAQDFLGRMVRSTAARRHPHLDFTGRQEVRDPSRQSPAHPAVEHDHR